MADTVTAAAPACPATGSPLPAPALSPIQRAYLVGDQAGLELRGPARYYLACDVLPARCAGIGERLRRLVRANAVLRADTAADLSLTVMPEEAVREVDVEVRRVADADFDAANEAVRRAFTADAFAFGGWPRFRVTVVAAASRARLHLVYALWLMDAASLEVFLAELVAGHGRWLDAAERDTSADMGATAGRRDRGARDRRFWRERAAALPGPAKLPLRPGWRQAGPAVAHRTVTVAAADAERVAEAARAAGVTPSMVYLAAYGSLLGRLGGGVAHTLTVLYSRRARPSACDLLGNDGATMPLEIPAPAGQSVWDLARAVQGRFLGQAVHGSLSGAEIARLGDPDADPRRLAHPYTFTALEVDGAGEAALGFRRRWDEVQLRVPQVLLDHQVFLDADGAVRLCFDWRADAFDAGFVEDFVAQHERLVGQLAAGAGTGAGGPSPAAPDRAGPAPRSRARPLAAPGASAEPATLHERVLSRAAATPRAPAVLDADGALSYGALAAHAHACAERLRAAGADAGDRVAVQLPRGRGQVVAILGSLLAGCVYIPLDRSTPQGRLASIARLGAVRFAITEERRDADDDGWAACGVTVLKLPARLPDRLPDRAPPRPSKDPIAPGRGPRPGPGRGSCPTAYTIFTSGSTGEPKGVVISHAAVLNTIDAVNDRLDLKPADRVLSVSSIGFDLSVYDVFGPLLRGGSVVMLSEETAQSPAAWSDLIARHRVTVWNSAPALALLLAEEGAALPHVRAFLLSGDWIPLSLPAALRRLAAPPAGPAPAGAAEVISLGGATEGAIWSIWHTVGEADGAGRSIPYGRAMPGQDVLVLDATGRECPDWHIGEIHLAGAGVAEGYANDPARTAAAFLDDPVFGRMYRTGDRGRRHPGGVVEFLGRTDSQVKLNGHRVELGEIEHVLGGVPGVRGGAVCVRGEDRRRRLVAYVTLAADAPAAWRRDAHRALARALPPYMVPDVLVELDEIPLTRNGKVDRRRLAALPLDEAPAPSRAAPPPPGLHGHEVARSWQELLGRPPGTESFFDAGGGSYDAIRLLSTLRGRFGYDVPFGAFMANPTAAGLAALCREARAPGSHGVWAFRPRPGGAPRLRLVLFPPVGGGVSCYHGLIRRLAGDVDVHVIGFDRPLSVARQRLTLAGLARHCLERLPREVLSGSGEGDGDGGGGGVPLVFGGWSFGGALAFEAARGCDAAVARVVVIDTPVGTARGDATPPEPSLAAFLRDVEETGGVAVDAEQAAEDPAFRDRFEVYRQNMALLHAWAPRPARVPAVEFRAAEDPAEPDAGAWRGIARIEASIPLAGGHFDVFREENVRLVKAAIEGVEAR